MSGGRYRTDALRKAEALRLATQMGLEATPLPNSHRP